MERHEKFVNAIVEGLHDDLEDQWNERRVNLREEDRDDDVVLEEFKARIREMNGTQLILVLEKYLFQIDIRSIENRLLIPLNQMRKEFWTEKREGESVGGRNGSSVTTTIFGSEITNVLKTGLMNFEA